MIDGIEKGDKVEVVHDTSDIQSERFQGVVVRVPCAEDPSWAIVGDEVRLYQKFGYIRKI